MIYFFSGTGNSREVARRLAADTNDHPVCMTDANQIRESNDVLGLVFPVYAWGMPRVVERFLRNTDFMKTLSAYTYMVCTCGDDIGRTDRQLRKLLAQKDISLDSAWSVRMPNTYVALPGFDVDTEDVAKSKIEKTRLELIKIAAAIKLRKRGIIHVRPGALPWLKTYVLRPLFNHFLTGDNHFRVADTCVGCKKCSTICPTHNIVSGKNGAPRWQGNCADCLACYHICPKQSIEYGRYSRGKGQYLMKENLF